MKKALENQSTEAAARRREMAMRFVCGNTGGYGGEEPCRLSDILDSNIGNIRIKKRGRQKIEHPRTSRAGPMGRHPSGAFLTHTMATGGVRPERWRQVGDREAERCESDVRMSAARHHEWTTGVLNRVHGHPDDEAMHARRFFCIWDLEMMEQRAANPEMALSTPRIVAIKADARTPEMKRAAARGFAPRRRAGRKKRQKARVARNDEADDDEDEDDDEGDDDFRPRISAITDNGTIEHMRTCMSEGTDMAGVIGYIVVPPENQFSALRLKKMCCSGRNMEQKIEKLILCGRAFNCIIRISHRIFDPTSPFYIPGLQERLEYKFPNLMHNLMLLPMHYHRIKSSGGSQ